MWKFYSNRFLLQASIVVYHKPTLRDGRTLSSDFFSLRAFAAGHENGFAPQFCGSEIHGDDAAGLCSTGAAKDHLCSVILLREDEIPVFDLSVQ